MEKAVHKLSYGLFVVTTKLDKIDNGCITNTVMQVTTNPNRICCAINKDNYTNELIKKSGVFNASIISEKADFELFKHFGFQSGRNVDKFADFDAWERSDNGVIYVTKGTNAYISAKVVEEIDLGTHTLFIADVTEEFVLSKANSATYAYYFENIKPKPASAPKKTLWRCNICGYEEVVDELPDDFTCPLCKHPKSDFTKVEA